MNYIFLFDWDWALIGIKTLQLICCLSLLVVLHEGGHFFFAKISGVKVEKFYMFFNPYFHLFSTRDKWFAKLFPRIAANETEYGIGWIPLGGYVSIAGMVDETKNAKDVGTEVHDYDFNSKPIWKRFLIMFGGVLVNFLTAVALYCIIMFTWGRDILPTQNIPGGLIYSQQAKEIGFRNGDTPIRIDGNEIEGFSGNLFTDISEAKTVTVLRNGKEVTLQMPEGGVSLLDMTQEPKFMAIAIPPVVGDLAHSYPAEKAGIRKGAQILSLDGDTITDQSDVTVAMLRHSDVLAADDCTHADSVKALHIQLCVLEPNATKPDTLQLALTDELKLGILWDTSQLEKIETRHISYTVLTCIPAGCRYGWDTMVDYVTSLKYLFSRKGAESVGSFITIGSIFPDAWDWQRFWSLTAFISIILAVMNILPIPGLDGGHIMLLLWEGITGKQPSPQALEIIEKIGMMLLIALMILAMGNDFMRFIL